MASLPKFLSGFYLNRPGKDSIGGWALNPGQAAKVLFLVLSFNFKVHSRFLHFNKEKSSKKETLNNNISRYYKFSNAKLKGRRAEKK
ncbi:MAG: hypothetical protein ABIR66_11080 [Saprospiraceae bacterium]